MNSIDCIVIGAGVVGLAVARSLAMAGRETVVLERESLIGSHTSSRNSEVIHAGIYYPKNSLKARHCVRGRQLLYDYCATHGVAHRNCGKIIVATDDAQIASLDGIQTAASNNGVADLKLLDAADLGRLEPDLRGVAGLLSPSTGIVDGHGLMLALQGEFEDHGGMIAFNTRFAGGEAKSNGIIVRAICDGEEMVLKAGLVINCAGLFAGQVADAIDGLPLQHRRTIHYCKGNYFGVSGRVPFRHLIYPVPEPGGLGIHLTVDLAGRGKFGPDVEWIDKLDYEQDACRASSFYAAIRTYWPALLDGALMPDYTGIRPKLIQQGEPAADFAIEGQETHDVAGLINMFGIESPGMTSALAIAEDVAGRVN